MRLAAVLAMLARSAIGQQRPSSLPSCQCGPQWGQMSRQRSWGVPIPAFYDEEGQGYLDADVIRGIADKVATSGTNCWYTSSAESLLSASIERSARPS